MLPPADLTSLAGGQSLPELGPSNPITGDGAFAINDKYLFLLLLFQGESEDGLAGSRVGRWCGSFFRPRLMPLVNCDVEKGLHAFEGSPFTVISTETAPATALTGFFIPENISGLCGTGIH